MHSLGPVPRTSLSEQVALQIVHMISAGRWKQGERLAPEAELCQVFQVGRSTLREALKSLAFVGIVRMRAGEGTYVADNPSKFIDRVLGHGLLDTEKDINDLCEARIVLEGELAALCAERATEEDLQNLDELLKEMYGPLPRGDEQFLDLDMRFHFAIASGSKNTILSRVLETIRALMQEVMIRGQQNPQYRAAA